MKMMSRGIMHTFALLLSVVALGVVRGGLVPCTWKDPQGNFYDLSPLTDCARVGYSVSGAPGDFAINFCESVKECNDGVSAICQDGTYDAGVASNISFSILNEAGQKGVMLTVAGGTNDGCPNNRDRSSVFNILCDPTAHQPVITVVSENPTCQYNFNVKSASACPTTPGPQKQNCPLHVWLVPHTHDDVGWLWTIDEYYQQAVKYILDTAVEALTANPARRFMYVEQAYFWRWWTDSNTSDAQRAALKLLVKNKQFDFVLGGWTMPDEACTTYGSEVDQLTLGHQFLLDNFDFTPTKGWQIDPFGASSVTPTLSKLAGFDVQLIDRVTNKGEMQNNQRLQFEWQGSPSLGAKSQIFGEIMGGGGAGYCDWFGAFQFSDDPVNSTNVGVWAQKFLDMANSRKAWYQTNNLLAAWGCDFAFQNANNMFHSMDQVVAYLQANEANTGVYVKYATLNDYWDAVFASSKASPNNVSYPLNVGGDFFGYDDSLWWTGYFTSRVELKGVVRKGESVGRAMETLYSVGVSQGVLKDQNSNYLNQLIPLRLANADATHHDGVSGTSNPDVVLMYQNDLLDGISSANSVGAASLSEFMTQKGNSPYLSSSFTSLLTLGNNSVVPLVLFNSLGWSRSDFVNVAVNRKDVRVVDSQKRPVPFQVNPAFKVDDDNVTSSYRLYFNINLPAMSFATYFVMQTSNVDEQCVGEISEPSSSSDDDNVVHENEALALTFSGKTGRLAQVTNKIKNVDVIIKQDVVQYISAHSGAYAFTPKGPAEPLSARPPVNTVVKGPLLSETYSVFPCDDASSSFVKQSIRLFNTNTTSPDLQNYFDIHFQLGVLPSHHEIVTRFSTDIKSAGTYATDDNGFEFQQRVYQYDLNIQGNYYPMVYASYIRDASAQLSLIGERSHGAASLQPGELEVMVHRNPDMGDGFGPGLTDTDIVQPSLRIVVSSPSAVPVHRHSYLFNFPVSVFVGKAVASVDAFTSLYATSAQFLAKDLPQNIHLLTFNFLGANKYILRLTHLFSVDEDTAQAQPVQVDLASLFVKLTISSVVETTLSANNKVQQSATPSSPVITIYPKEIRTFVISF